MEILVATLHHALAFTVFATLFAEHLLFRKGLGFRDARRLQKVDLIYGLCALALVGVGMLRVLCFGKGPSVYFASPFFWTKMALFGVVGVLSAYPTIRFMSWNPVVAHGDSPSISDRDVKVIRTLIRAEMLGIGGIVFCAVALAA